MRKCRCRICKSEHLLVGIDENMTLDALLSHVGPAVAAHPFPLALGTLVLPETSLLALVRGQAFAFGTCLDREFKDFRKSLVHYSERFNNSDNQMTFIYVT